MQVMMPPNQTAAESSVLKTFFGSTTLHPCRSQGGEERCENRGVLEMDRCNQNFFTLVKLARAILIILHGKCRCSASCLIMQWRRKGQNWDRNRGSRKVVILSSLRAMILPTTENLLDKCISAHSSVWKEAEFWRMLDQSSERRTCWLPSKKLNKRLVELECYYIYIFSLVAEFHCSHRLVVESASSFQLNTT